MKGEINMKIYTILVNVKTEEDIIEIIRIARSEGLNGGKVSRALICDNILYMVIED